MENEFKTMNQQDENIDPILGRIDEALLKAKSKGRNRMESC